MGLCIFCVHIQTSSLAAFIRTALVGLPAFAATARHTHSSRAPSPIHCLMCSYSSLTGSNTPPRIECKLGQSCTIRCQLYTQISSPPFPVITIIRLIYGLKFNAPHSRLYIIFYIFPLKCIQCICVPTYHSRKYIY